MTRLSVETASMLARDLNLKVDDERLADMASELSHLFTKMEVLPVPVTTEPFFSFVPLIQEDVHDR
jgi:hypothetical protein